MIIQNSDYDKRQVELIKKQIKFFQQGVIGLGMLISRLESLFSVLENKDVPWRTSFWKGWDSSESVFADVLDEESSSTFGSYTPEGIPKTLFKPGASKNLPSKFSNPLEYFYGQ